MTTQKKTDANLADNAPDGIALSDAEQAAARKEGAKEDVKDAAKDTHRYLTDGNLPGDPPANQYLGSDEIQMWAYIIDLGVEDFEKRVASKGDDAVPEEKVAGLLKLERAGQNRTPYVKAMMKRLGIKGGDLYKITTAGPAYTNDVTNITDL